MLHTIIIVSIHYKIKSIYGLQFGFSEPIKVLWLPVSLRINGDVDNTGSVGDSDGLGERNLNVLDGAAEVSSLPKHLHHLLIPDLAGKRCWWSAETTY